MDAAQQLQLLTTALRESPHNLVSARDREQLADRHLPECIAFASILPKGQRVIDIGSGGGLPGMVIAICRPDLEVHLVESRRKKVDFLAQVAGTTGVVVQIHHARAEDAPITGPIVTARAVAPFVRLLPYAASVVEPGGELWAIKGESWALELEQAPNLAGFHLIEAPDDVRAHAVAHELPPGVDVDAAALPRVVRLRHQRA